MELFTKSESLPRQLTRAERKRRLEAERRLPDEVIAKIEIILRKGLWKRYQDDVSVARRNIRGVVALNARWCDKSRVTTMGEVT